MPSQHRQHRRPQAHPRRPPAPAYPARVTAQLERAVQLAHDGQTQDAELEFRQLIEAAPDAAGPAYDLGVLLRAAGRLEDAEAHSRWRPPAVPAVPCR